MPVVRAEPPVMTAEIVGAVHDRDLLDALFTGKAQLADRLADHLSPPLPLVGSGESVRAAMAALETADAAVVVTDGRPVGVLTRQDVLAFLSVTSLSGTHSRHRGLPRDLSSLQRPPGAGRSAPDPVGARAGDTAMGAVVHRLSSTAPQASP